MKDERMEIRFHRGTRKTRSWQRSALVMEVKEEMKDRDSSTSAGAPVARIRPSLTRLRQELVQTGHWNLQGP